MHLLSLLSFRILIRPTQNPEQIQNFVYRYIKTFDTFVLDILNRIRQHDFD